MDMTTRPHGAWTILAPSGRLDALGAPELESIATRLVADGVTSLTLDLAGVPYLSSAGLRVLLGLHKRLTTSGGSFAVLAPGTPVREVLAISGFLALLQVFESPQDLP